MHTSSAPRPAIGPIIAVTGRIVPGGVIGLPSGFADAPVDCFPSEYAESVAAAGGLPFYVPLGLHVEAVADRVDGLLLSGGADVDPVRYGGVAGPRSGTLEPQRDEFEIALFQAVRERGKPVLGICRGAQLVNVALGGTLVADLELGTGESHASYAYPRATRRHGVDLEPATLGHTLFGDRVQVNSFHHQAIDRAASGLVVSGRAPDGVVEVVESADGQFLGVQWHPECLTDDPVFAWLIDASWKVAGTQLTAVALEEPA